MKYNTFYFSEIVVQIYVLSNTINTDKLLRNDCRD